MDQMDIGDSVNFVSLRVAEDSKLKCEPAAAKLWLADNTESAFMGTI